MKSIISRSFAVISFFLLFVHPVTALEAYSDEFITLTAGQGCPATAAEWRTVGADEVEVRWFGPIISLVVDFNAAHNSYSLVFAWFGDLLKAIRVTSLKYLIPPPPTGLLQF